MGRHNFRSYHSIKEAIVLTNDADDAYASVN